MSVDLAPAVAYPARPTLPSAQAPAGRRYIYLVFTHTGTRFSKVLKMVTRGEYTHVSIAMDASLNRLYSFGRNSIKERPWEAGFVCEQKDGGVYRELPGTRCTVYQLEVSEEQYRRAQEIIDLFLRHQSVFKYNYPGLFFMSIGWVKRCKRRFVCSQFVAYVLENSGTMRFQKDFSLMRPADLKGLLYAPVYTGMLRSYSAARAM